MLFFILYDKRTLTKFEYFSKIYSHVSFHDPVLSFAPTSRFRLSAILLLPIVGIRMYKSGFACVKQR